MKTNEFRITERMVEKLKSDDPTGYSMILSCDDGTDLILQTLKKSQEFYKETKNKGLITGFMFGIAYCAGVYLGKKIVNKVQGE